MNGNFKVSNKGSTRLSGILVNEENEPGWMKYCFEKILQSKPLVMLKLFILSLAKRELSVRRKLLHSIKAGQMEFEIFVKLSWYYHFGSMEL